MRHTNHNPGGLKKGSRSPLSRNPMSLNPVRQHAHATGHGVRPC